MKYKITYKDNHVEYLAFIDYAYRRFNKFMSLGGVPTEQAVGFFNSDKSKILYNGDIISKPNDHKFEAVVVDTISDLDYEKAMKDKDKKTNYPTHSSEYILTKLSDQCHKYIENGFYIIHNGEKHQVTLSLEDQLNLNRLNVCAQLDLTGQLYPYHFKGEIESYFSAEVIRIIHDAYIMVLSYFVSRYNCFKKLGDNIPEGAFFTMPLKKEWQIETYVNAKKKLFALKESGISIDEVFYNEAEV